MVYVSTKQIDSSQEGLAFDVKPRIARGFDCLLTFFYCIVSRKRIYK